MRLKVIKAPGRVGRVPGNRTVYPWPDLKVGGAFEVVSKSWGAVRSGAHCAGKRLKRRFSVHARPGTKDRFVVRRVK